MGIVRIEEERRQVRHDTYSLSPLKSPIQSVQCAVSVASTVSTLSTADNVLYQSFQSCRMP
jgi:hypothetical protein